MADTPQESRAKLAEKIIKEYDKRKGSNREEIEEEIRMITGSLGASDSESDDDSAFIPDRMVDTTTREARSIAINGIMGSMFPPNNKWFSNKLTNQLVIGEDGKQVELSETDKQSQQDALEKVGDLQFRQLGQDNFYGAMAEALAPYLDFGSLNIRLRKGKRRFAHFQAVTRGQYKFQLDDEGFPDIVWAYHKLSAYAIKTMFGYNGLTQRIKTAIDEEKIDQMFVLINKIERRDGFDSKKKGERTSDPSKREYKSVWASRDDKDILGNATMPRRKIVYEDGLYFNEYTIARLASIAGQSEGQGLTTLMLPTIRGANQKKINIIKASNIKADPPWYEDESNPLGDDARIPGGTVNIDGFSTESQVGPVDLRGIDIDAEKMGLAEDQQAIKTAFFNQAFKMFTDMDVATNRKTAFESRLIKAEQQSMVASVLYGLVEECVKVLLPKHLDLMVQEGKIPKDVIEALPENYEIELTSQFAKSIEATRAQDLMTAVEFSLQIDQIVPGTARSTLKWHKALRKVMLDLEIDVEDIIPIKESEKLMKKELDNQQALVESQIANQGADAVSKLTP